MKTEQKSLRLSRYYLSIMEDLQEKNGLSFTDAIKHIITEYAKNQNNENSINSLLQNLKKSLKGLNLTAASDYNLNGQEIIDELNNIGNNIQLILKALMIIGSSDSRTIIDIENLFEEDE